MTTNGTTITTMITMMVAMERPMHHRFLDGDLGRANFSMLQDWRIKKKPIRI